MTSKINIQLTALALTAWASTACAQSLLWSDAFSNPDGWQCWNGQISFANQQAAISGSFGPTDTNNPAAYLAWAYHPIPNPGPLPDQQTLEARVDLVSANQNEAWADVAFLWPTDGRAYHFFKDQGELGLLKGSSTWSAFFFWENLPLKNQNVTLVLSLTRLGSDVRINIRVLDKDNANAILFEHTVTDTPQADPVLPSRTVNGFISWPDLAGTPWPVISAPGYVILGMGWADPEHATQGAAEVIYDNLEVWQYGTPPLAIQNAVVLSWLAPQGAKQFVLESAPSVTGPWAPVSDPWSRTNATQIEVSVLASQSMRLFRLRFLP
jgi:hypothetical protein